MMEAGIIGGVPPNSVMDKVPLVYHERYDLNFGRHVFPTEKYRLIRNHLIAEGLATAEDFHQPKAANDGEIRLVHTEDWVRSYAAAQSPTRKSSSWKCRIPAKW